MPLGPVLSEADKAEIKEKLERLCEQSWITSGYKKTSIKKLCLSAGISIGTFYTLYLTKEDLFFDTLSKIQNRLTKSLLEICEKNPTKEGFAHAMKELFREYDSKPFLYNVNTKDFQAFVTKLPNEAVEKLKFDSVEFSKQVIKAARLELKIDESEAYGILSALLSTINAREALSKSCDYIAVFNFMVDNLIPSIFK